MELLGLGLRFGMSAIHCTLCMIARDEADVIGESLESVRGVVDEVIVVDTGSVDRTPEIAAEQGARVVREPWADDFSAARNRSIELAGGRWIFIVDADERLEASSREELATLLSEEARIAYRFRQHTYLDHDRASGLQSCDSMPEIYRHWPGYLLARQTRLFPRHPRLRYSGRVHEELVGSLEREGIESRDSNVILHHLGKVRGEERAQRKRELYLKLGQEKLAQGGDARSRYELGIALLEVGDAAQAGVQLRRAAAEADDLALKSRCIASASRAMCAVGRDEEALEWLTQGLPEVAMYLPVWEAWADTLLRLGRPEVAVTVLENCLPLFPEELQLWRMMSRAREALGQFDLARSAEQRGESPGDGKSAPRDFLEHLS